MRLISAKKWMREHRNVVSQRSAEGLTLEEKGDEKGDDNVSNGSKEEEVGRQDRAGRGGCSHLNRG